MVCSLVETSSKNIDWGSGSLFSPLNMLLAWESQCIECSMKNLKIDSLDYW